MYKKKCTILIAAFSISKWTVPEMYHLHGKIAEKKRTDKICPLNKMPLNQGFS